MNPYKIHIRLPSPNPRLPAAAAADLRLVLAFTDAGHVHGAKVASVFAKARENSRVRNCNFVYKHTSILLYNSVYMYNIIIYILYIF